MTTERWPKLGIGSPKKSGSLAGRRPCVRLGEHLCASYEINFGKTTHMSHKILKVQNDTQGQVRGPTTHLPTPTPLIAPLTEMSSGTHFLCILLV